MRLYKEEMDVLKQIINDVFLVDINENRRLRNLVDAKRVYSKMLRDMGCSYPSIGKSIGKNHATIMHYIKTIDTIMMYDADIRNKYIACKNIFVEKKDSVFDELKKDVDVYVTVVRLKNELQEAVSSKNESLSNFVDYIEQYEKKKGSLPSIYDYRNTILPLFNR